mgnify:FL=1
MRWILAAALFYPMLLTWVYFVALAEAPPAVQQFAYGLGKSVQFALPLLVLVSPTLRQWRKATAGHPLTAANALRWGLAFGLTAAGAIWIGAVGWFIPSGQLLEAVEPLRAKLTGFQLDSPTRFLAMAVFYSLAHSGLEEYYWRWFVFAALCGELSARSQRATIAAACAVAGSSIAFALHHVIVLAQYFGWASPLTWCFSAATAIGGGFWAWLYHHSGRLLAPWISHAVIDAALFAVGYRLVFGP